MADSDHKGDKLALVTAYKSHGETHHFKYDKADRPLCGSKGNDWARIRDADVKADRISVYLCRKCLMNLPEDWMP